MGCRCCSGLMVPEDDAMRCIPCGHYEFPERADPLVSLPPTEQRKGQRYSLGPYRPRQTPGNRRHYGRRL